jgi:hypothetical protein
MSAIVFPFFVGQFRSERSGDSGKVKSLQEKIQIPNPKNGDVSALQRFNLPSFFLGNIFAAFEVKSQGQRSSARDTNSGCGEDWTLSPSKLLHIWIFGYPKSRLGIAQVDPI